MERDDTRNCWYCSMINVDQLLYGSWARSSSWTSSAWTEVPDVWTEVPDKTTAKIELVPSYIVSESPMQGTNSNKQSPPDYYEQKSQTTTEKPAFTTWLIRCWPCMSISLFMLGCNASYASSVICAMSHMYTCYDLFLTIMIAVLWLISWQSYILTWSLQHLSVYSILPSTWYTSYSQHYRGTLTASMLSIYIIIPVTDSDVHIHE